MKNTIPFVLGILFTILIAASTNIVQVVQPKVPEVTEVKTFKVKIGIEYDIKRYIDQKTSEGFILKSMVLINDETISKGIVVVEKY